MSFWKDGFWSIKFWSDGFWGKEATEQVAGGAGYPVGAFVSPTGIKRKRTLESDLAEQMREAYNEILGIAKPHVKKQAARIVSPYIENGIRPSTLPPISIIDWQALAKDIDKVSALLELWQREIQDDQEDEELILLMMAA